MIMTRWRRRRGGFCSLFWVSLTIGSGHDQQVPVNNEGQVFLVFAMLMYSLLVIQLVLWYKINSQYAVLHFVASSGAEASYFSGVPCVSCVYEYHCAGSSLCTYILTVVAGGATAVSINENNTRLALVWSIVENMAESYDTYFLAAGVLSLVPAHLG